MPRFESKWGGFFEVEVEDCVLTQLLGEAAAEQSGASPGKSKLKTFKTADEAGYAAARLIKKRRRAGYRLVGASRHLAGGRDDGPQSAASTVALEAFFAAGDSQFLGELLRSIAGGTLAGLAERWYVDSRPWARQELIAYIDDGCDRPHHKGLVKRLFKRAEAAGDDELMAHFMVAFDRLSRRYLIDQGRSYWDHVKRKVVHEEKLVLVADPSIAGRLAKPSEQKGRAQRKQAADESQFTRATRRYLARRVNRYFRVLAHRDMARYGQAIRRALPLYTDAALSTVSRLLDAWSLMHALYGRSPVLVRGPGDGVRLADSKSLGDLVPAPMFDAAWAGAFDELVALAMTAGSRTVRAWSVAMLRARYASELAGLAVPAVKRLITSPHAEVFALGAELIRRVRGLELLPLTEWLELLAVEDLDVLAVIAELAERMLSPARLSLAQCIDLACSKTAPVARLGLAWAKTKPIATVDDLRAVARLVRAGVPTVRDEGAQWALSVVGGHPAAQPEHVRDLCDGPHADARSHALAVVAGSERFAGAPQLWMALTESPYADVRAFVIRHATRWRDEAPAATLRHVWSTAVLSIYGSGAAKARVPRQIAERIAAHPHEARELLPVLGHALRSVRPAERALALGALARAARATPGLVELAHELLPELTLSAQVSS